MPQFAKSLFVAYATRNKRMPDFKCAIIALINKKKKHTKNRANSQCSKHAVRATGKKKKKIRTSCRAAFMLIELIG